MVVLVVVKEVVKLAVQSPRSGLYQVVGIKAQSTELYEIIAATAFVSGPHSTRSNHTVSTQPPRGALDHCSAVRVNAACVIWNLDMNTYYAYTFGRAQAHSGQTLALHICVAASITALHQAGYSSDSGAFLIHALCSFGSSLGFQNSIEVLQTCRSCPSAQPRILSRAR